MSKFKQALKYAAAAFVGGSLFGGALWAQSVGFVLISPVIVGHLNNGGSGSAAAPTLAGCTAVGAPTDTDGTCTSSATSGSITFAAAYASAPNCVVIDETSAATVPQFTYTIAASAITISTMTSGHKVGWHCASNVGG